MKKMKKLKKISLIMVMVLLISTIGSARIFAVEDLPEEEISDVTDNQAFDNAETESPSDETEESVLGYGCFVGPDNKDWSHRDHIRFKYDHIEKNNMIYVTPKVEDGKVKAFSTAYDPVDEYTYGIMNVVGIDNNGGLAFVRISDVKEVEAGKEYEAEFLFDVDKQFGHGEPESDYTIQIIGQRIYLYISHLYKIYSPETKPDPNGRDSYNASYIYLLYSFDTEGDNIKLHMREARVHYDAAKWPSWILNGYGTPKAIQNIDGKWYALSLSNTGDYHKSPLDDEVSESGIDGFLSPSDEWFQLNKRYGKDYMQPGEDVWETNSTVTTYEQMLYVRQWMFDNGYTKHLYLSSLVEGEDGLKKERQEIEKAKKEKDKEKGDEEYSGDLTTVSADKVFVVKDKIDANSYMGNASGKIRYVSSDKKIATAKKSGIIKAKNPGKVVITRQMKVGKKWVNVSALTLNICRPTTALPKNTLELKADPNATYNIADYILSEATDAPTYTISSSGMAVIGSDATKMTPLAAGKATITAKFNNYKLKVKVIVTP